jgi:nucleoside 2-deoxyribosyltransferase
MAPKLIYLAGPFTATDSWGIEMNIRAVEEVMDWLLHRSSLSICTHSFGRMWRGREYESKMIELGVELVRRCDAVLLVGEWRRSAGTKAEVAEAFRRGKPVYVSLRAFEYNRPAEESILDTFVV